MYDKIATIRNQNVFSPALVMVICARGDPIILIVCFVALHPKSTAMVMAGRSVQLTTLFPGQA